MLSLLPLLPLPTRDMQDTLVQVGLGPTHIDGFAGAQSVPVDQAQKHLIAERIPTALTGGVKQAARLVWAEIPTIPYLRLFCPWSNWPASAGPLE